MASRNVKRWWIGGAFIALILLTATAFYLYRQGQLYGFSHLEPVHDESVHLIMGTSTASGIPTPVADPLVLGISPRFRPHFPFSNFFKARNYARSACYQMMIKHALPEGSYSVSVSNAHGAVLLPLEQQAPDLYVSTPFLFVQDHFNTTYFFGYGILTVEFGKEEPLSIQLEKSVPGRK